MSGYDRAAAAELGVLPPGVAFLSKPFTPTTLARTARETLDDRPVPSPVDSRQLPLP